MYKLTDHEQSLLKSFNSTYSKYNPVSHPDYEEVSNIISNYDDVVPCTLTFKVRLAFVLGLLDGTSNIDRYFANCNICNTRFKKAKKSSKTCEGCLESGKQYCNKHDYIHGIFGGYSTCLQCDVEKYDKKFANSTHGYDYVVCPLCTLKSGDLAKHYSSVHGLTKE